MCLKTNITSQDIMSRWLHQIRNTINIVLFIIMMLVKCKLSCASITVNNINTQVTAISRIKLKCAIFTLEWCSHTGIKLCSGVGMNFKVELHRSSAKCRKKNFGRAPPLFWI